MSGVRPDYILSPFWKSSHSLYLSQRERKGSLPWHNQFSRYLFNIVCAVLQGSVGSSREGDFISIIAFNMFHYLYLILIMLIEHANKEQFDCEQVEKSISINNTSL